MAASILFIIFFALILAALLTVIFAFEAFVMELYTGLGQKYIVSSFFFLSSPYPNKICSLSLVLQPHHPLPRARPARFGALPIISQKLHGLGEPRAPIHPRRLAHSQNVLPLRYRRIPRPSPVCVRLRVWGAGNGTAAGAEIWMDESSAMRQLNPSRLQDQVFASTVADQVVDMFNEVGLPYILRFVESIYDGISRKVRSRALSEEDKQQQQQQSVSKRDWSETEKEEGKREFLERVRSEVALPPYDLVDDYSEMITQFGYVVLWSTIWPLAPGEKITQISYLFLLVPPPLLFLYFIFGWLD